VPMVPVAPATFSTTTVPCSTVESRAATMRPTTSVPPPGGNGTTSRMGLAG